LSFAEPGQSVDVPHTSMLLEHASQRRTARQTATTTAERIVEILPVFRRLIQDISALLAWPATGVGFVGIGPGQYLTQREWR
jgi:hypothetical protein